MAWNRSNDDQVYLINRYPICATWYYVVAKYLGYTEDQAKSMGIARAIFFARAKAVGNRGAKKSGTKLDVNAKTEKNQPDIDSIQFAGLAVYIDREDGIAIFGNEKMTSAGFNRSVIEKMNNKKLNYFEKVVEKMTESVSKYSKAEMNSQIAYSVYQKIRDEMRQEKVVFA